MPTPHMTYFTLDYMDTNGDEQSEFNIYPEQLVARLTALAAQGIDEVQVSTQQI